MLMFILEEIMAALSSTQHRSLQNVHGLQNVENSNRHIGSNPEHGQQRQQRDIARSSTSRLAPLLEAAKRPLLSNKNTETRFTFPNTETRFTLPREASSAKLTEESGDKYQRLNQFLDQLQKFSDDAAPPSRRSSPTAKKARAPDNRLGLKNLNFKRHKADGQNALLNEIRNHWYHYNAYNAMTERIQHMTPTEKAAEHRIFNEEWAPILGYQVFKAQEMKLPSDLR